MGVPFFDLIIQNKEIGGGIINSLSSLKDTGQFILGNAVSSFEEEIKAYLGVIDAIGVASGSDALYLALKGIALEAGDYVITTPFTFFATAGSIVRAGGIPLFIDIDYNTMNISPQSIKDFLDNECKKGESGITFKKNNRKIKAIIVVHLFGHPVEMGQINKISKEYGIGIIEDTAQAISAKWDEKYCGTIGQAGCLSFFPTKNLGAWGDGGMVLTNEKLAAKRVRMLRVHGACQTYIHEEVGINSRLDAIQALILSKKLPYLLRWTDRRRLLAKRYIDMLRDNNISGITMPPFDGERAFSVFHQFVIRAKERDGLKAYLDKRGIGNAVYYPMPLHLQPCFSFLGYKNGDLPYSENASKEVLALPIFPELTENEQDMVVSAICDFYRGKK